jgi:nitroimidazol reductase NimA-like FMN-containing flavoprotein (pyridoxamine 5'-phosphate oxidase superfamily)
MSTDPSYELLELPPGYGTPRTPLAWADVRARLEEARHYWLATVRPDGRPHVVPLDGLWHANAWYFGGSSGTVKHRNLTSDARAAMHLEDATWAIIVEGACEELVPDEGLAAELSERSRAKYGYGPDPASYQASGSWRLRPATVLAWSRFPEDATRFAFGSG